MTSGQLVHIARERNTSLASIDLETARSVHSAFDASVLAVVGPRVAIAAKKSSGGTAPERVEEQIAWVRAAATELGYKASSVPSLDDLRRAVARQFAEAASSPSSTKRRFVRKTVDVPTEMFAAMAASVEPASAASRI
jgi:hypothetical protein